MTKLTEKQFELLELLGDRFAWNCSDTYQPAKELVSLGYAKWVDGTYSKVLYLTPEGRAALEEINAARMEVTSCPPK